MKHSSDRILTTHAGRLEGPPEYRQMTTALMAGQPVDAAAMKSQLRGALVDVIRKQAAAHVDILSDGELAKTASGSAITASA